MRASKWSYPLFLVVVLFSISSHPSQATDLKGETEDDKDVGIVELNPNYRKVEPEDESDDESFTETTGTLAALNDGTFGDEEDFCRVHAKQDVFEGKFWTI